VNVPRNPECLVCGQKGRMASADALSLDDLVNLGNVTYEQDESGQ